MNSSEMVSFKNSIANQLLKVVFSVYLILTFTVTIIHMVTEYTHTRQKVIEELRTIESTFKPTLSRALWDMNFDQIRSAFLGIEKLPTVIGVQVEDNEGKLIGMAGKIIKSDGTSVLVDRMGRETVVEKAYGLFWHEFSVTHLRQNRTFQLGNVRLYSSASVVLDKVMLTFIFLIINAVIKIVALWLIFLYVFRLILGRPLSALTNATRQIHLDNLEDVSINIKTSKRNELKVLETAFNEMIDKLLSARSRLNDYMDEETERLEGLVEERTRELTVSEGRFRRSEAELRALFASMTDVILVLNREGLYLKIAPTSSELLYKPPNELINKTLHEVFPEHEAQRFLDAIHRSLNQNTTVIIEYALHIGGREVWFDGRISPISEDTIIFVARDITERKRAEEELRKYSETQEVLVQEVNHRVKNNLSAIIGMLYKEQDRAKAEGVTDLNGIRDLQGRIEGLSTVHSLLSASSWRPLLLSQLCEEVINAALQGVPLDTKILMKIKDSPVRVNSNQAHHLTLLINELATNTIKHALVKRDRVSIGVEIYHDNNNVRIVYRDDGSGYPEEMIAGDMSHTSVGFDIIKGIVKKSLRGKVLLENNNGAVTVIVFSLEDVENQKGI